MSKYSYWTELRGQTTSNSQVPGGLVTFAIPARRLPTDTYVRSLWWASVSYGSDGSAALPSWWIQSRVSWTAQFDPLGILTRSPDFVTSPSPFRVARGMLVPQRFANPEFNPNYQVVWTSGQGVVEASGRRKGLGTTLPRVVATVQCFDQDGFFDGTAEPAYILRVNLCAAVLWESDAPTPT